MITTTHISSKDPFFLLLLFIYVYVPFHYSITRLTKIIMFYLVNIPIVKALPMVKSVRLVVSCYGTVLSECLGNLDQIPGSFILN